MGTRTDRAQGWPGQLQDLGADERRHCVHGGRDERHELLRVLPVSFAAVLRQPVGVRLQRSQGLGMPAGETENRLDGLALTCLPRRCQLRPCTSAPAHG